MSYLRFEDAGYSVSGLTKWWHVFGSDEHIIGRVHWKAPWRKYIFTSAGSCDFDSNCLEEISDFCKAQTTRHRTGV